MTRELFRRRLATVAVAACTAAVTTVAVTAGPASAAVGSFAAPDAITINDAGNAAPVIFSEAFDPVTLNAPATLYPSTATVAGNPGRVTNVAVTLHDVDHSFINDVDIMLVGPDGKKVMLLSDTLAVTNGAGALGTFQFDALGETITTELKDGKTYHPQNLDGGDDAFPAPAPDAAGVGTDLTVFDNTDPNGVWKLYASDAFGEVGEGILGGWTLDLTTDATTPVPASSYPSTATVSGLPKGVTDVDVTLKGFSHSLPSDVDMMLVGPTGASVMLMSDAGGNAADALTDVDLTFDDSAAAQIPETPNGGSRVTSGSYLPSNFNPGGAADVFPAPAPSSTSANLSVFNGTDPNGTWKLFVVDQVANSPGEIAGGWSLRIATKDLPAAPTLTAPANGLLSGDGILTFRGSGPAGSSVSIADGNTVVATGTVDGAGSYVISLAGVPSGSHSYTATVTDPIGNTSARSTAVSVTVDSVAPNGTIKVNGDKARTNKPSVALTLAATDPAPGTGVSQMRFSNDGTTFTAFEPFTAQTVWNLTAGDGTKTVWVQFADRAGKVSATVADSITLDTVAPGVRRFRPAANATRVGVRSNVTVTVTEALNAASVTGGTVRLLHKGKAVRASVSYNAAKQLITINPRRALARHATYRVVLGTKVLDLAGNALDSNKKAGAQPKVWKFTTG